MIGGGGRGWPGRFFRLFPRLGIPAFDVLPYGSGNVFFVFV
ncbi:MAG: hypothetical protein HPY66_1184 [Firmicutes bacterium]|nr:hypothetical protein [Bacillota bacterium]